MIVYTYKVKVNIGSWNDWAQPVVTERIYFEGRELYTFSNLIVMGRSLMMTGRYEYRKSLNGWKALWNESDLQVFRILEEREKGIKDQ